MSQQKLTQLIKGSSILLGINVLLSFFVVLFNQHLYSFDIECYLYFGQRLDQGILIFTKDFDVKFPLVQYLFYVVYKLGDISYWHLMVLSNSIIFGSIASYLLSIYLIKSNPNFQINKNTLSIFLFNLFVSYQLLFPIDKTIHIQALASVWVYFGISAVLYGVLNQNKKILFVAGMMCILAFILRPNFLYIFPLILILIWRVKSEVKIKLVNLVFFAWGVILVLILNFIPYTFIPNGMNSLIEGILGISSFPGGSGYLDLLKNQMKNESFFYINFYGYCLVIFLLISIYRNKINSRLWAFILILFSSVLCINLSFIKTHYWVHYFVIFSFLTPFIYLIFIEFTLINPRLKTLIYILSLSLLIGPISKTSAEISELISSEKSIKWNNGSQNIDVQLLRYLTKIQNEGKHFYVLNYPIYHALLGEERVGDGHPAIFEVVSDGYKLRTIKNIPLLNLKADENVSTVFKLYNKKILVLNAIPSHVKLANKIKNNPTIHMKKLIIPNLNNYLIYELSY